jgi:hypothetical protein
MASFATLRTLWAALLRVAARVPASIARFSAPVIGRWEWQPPSWIESTGNRLARAGRYLAADAKRTGLILLVLTGVIPNFDEAFHHLIRQP